MRGHLLKLCCFSALFLLPYSAMAEKMSPESANAFNKTCVKTWMERADKTSDKVVFQDFGEKYCHCAETQPLANDADIDKAAKVCMARTLLYTTMNSFDSYKDLTEDKITTACGEQWTIVYPGMDDKIKAFATSYCQCAAPKLLVIGKDADNLTDDQFNDKINDVAATCSAAITPSNAAPAPENKPAAPTTPTTTTTP